MYWNKLKKTDNLTGSLYFPGTGKGLRILYAFFIFSVISGCASIPIPKEEPIHVDMFSPYIMPDGSKIYPSSVDKTIPDVDVLAINDEIKALINEEVNKIRDPQKRLKLLSKILVRKISYDTMDDGYGVKTAQETFDTGTGNCLSFTNLFVAMARFAGFKSKFSEIPTLPNWTRDGEVLFFTRHIGASVDVRSRATQVIQLEVLDGRNRVITMDNTIRYYFAPSELSPDDSRLSTFSFTIITDNRAFAQYYNNIGSKNLAEGNIPEAYRYFIKALKTDPELSFAWSNLGVIYRRNNQPDAAEAAYLQGFTVTQGSSDTSVLTIMNNLTNLYNSTGEKEKAELYKTRLASFREKNPYYQYAVGKTAYDEKLFDESIGLFKKAIRLKNDEHLFYYGLALAYLKTGENKKAEINMNNAIDLSWDDKRKTYYKRILNIMRDDN